MENARVNLVEQISDLIKKYTDECLKIKEKEKSNETNNFLITPIDIYDLSQNDIEEDQYFNSLTDIRKCFSHYRNHNEKVKNLLKELNDGKYDDVFAYYDFKKESIPVTNKSAVDNTNVGTYVSEDYPLIKKPERRTDIEMISDPQMVLNFPTVSSIKENEQYPFNISNSTASIQQEHSSEIPLRKLISQKKIQPPSISSIHPTSNQTENIAGKETPKLNEPIVTHRSSSGIISPIVPTAAKNNLTQNSVVYSQKSNQINPAPTSQQYSQPNPALKFLDLYPPDPPTEFPPPLAKPLRKKPTINSNNNSITNSPNSEVSTKEASPSILSPSLQNVKSQDPKVTKSEPKSSDPIHFLSSSTDAFEYDSIPSSSKSSQFNTPVKSNNSFKSPTNSPNPFITNSDSSNPFAISSETPNAFNIAPNVSYQFNLEKNASNQPNSLINVNQMNESNRPNFPTNKLNQINGDNQNLPNQQNLPSNTSNQLNISAKASIPFGSSQNTSNQLGFQPYKTNQLNVAQNSTNSLSSPNKSPNPFQLPIDSNSLSPISTMTFHPIITSPANANLHFLTSSTSDYSNSNPSTSGNSSLTADQSSSLQKDENKEETDTDDDDNESDSIINSPSSNENSSSSTQKANEGEELMKPIITGEDVVSKKSEKNFLGDDEAAQSENESSDKTSKNEKEIKSDSSSDFDEENLSQSLHKSGFIFNDNSVNSLGNMVQSSENPYMKLDAITRLPINKK